MSYNIYRLKQGITTRLRNHYGNLQCPVCEGEILPGDLVASKKGYNNKTIVIHAKCVEKIKRY